MSRPTAEFRFYEELNDFLPAHLRKQPFPVEVDRSRSVKDAIESAGVPHTEVDLILVDGNPVGFDCVIHGGERIAVYPEFERLDIAPLQRLRERPLREPRFVADAHLGKLARHLRMAGFDCLWSNDYSDDEIVGYSVAQMRTILTRDKGILKRRIVTRGYFVRETDSEAQLAEVIRAFQLEGMLRPFTRCRECNVELNEVEKERVLELLPAGVRQLYDRFKLCSGCGRVYWEGTHYERMRRVLARLASPPAANP